MANSKVVAASIATAITLVTATVTDFGRSFTRKHEGSVLVAYKDPVGIPTICSGHTGGVKLGMVATQAQCDELLTKDLEIALSELGRCIRPDVVLFQDQWMMLADFMLNYGPGKKGVKDGFCTLKSGKPTTISKQVNSGNCPGVVKSFGDWNKAGGKELRGLKIRNQHRSEVYGKWCAK